jgi:protein-disulfide isomerase
LTKIGSYILNFLLILTLLSGCKAQGGSPAADLPALDRDSVERIQTAIRKQYNVASQINIGISAPKASDIPGYDQIIVTLTSTNADKQTTFDFLISKDRKTLGRLEKMNLQKVELPKETMAKMGLEGRPTRGNSAAKVTIVSYDDFQCPWCSRMHAMLFPGLLQAYGDKVKFVYKDFPLIEIHPWALHAAVDANCLADQSSDAYWDFADYVHANQRAVSGKNPGEAFANLDNAARDQVIKHHLNAEKANACVVKQDETAVRASMAAADKMGVDSTPTLYVNGVKLNGPMSEEGLHAILDHALADAGDKAPTTNAKN